jgi:hypothetical protein
MLFNYIFIWRDKHDAWHFLFGSRTLAEVLRFLKPALHKQVPEQRRIHWNVLFKKNSTYRAYKILLRVHRIKTSQLKRKKVATVD